MKFVIDGGGGLWPTGSAGENKFHDPYRHPLSLTFRPSSGKLSVPIGNRKGGEAMPRLRLVRKEPRKARENVALRRMLARLTYGTNSWRQGFALLPQEAQALYSTLAHRQFSPYHLDQIDAAIREMDPQEIDSEWNTYQLAMFVQIMRQYLDRPEWIDEPLRRLYAAMRAQGPDKRFRLWFVRAALVVFLTIDFVPLYRHAFRLAG